MHLASARIFVDRLEVAVGFYRRLLGDPAVHRPGLGHAVFRSAGVDVVLEAVDPSASSATAALIGRQTGLSFVVEDIAARYAALAASGVRFVAPPEPQPWGGTTATLVDPSGNALQLVQYPACQPGAAAV